MSRRTSAPRERRRSESPPFPHSPEHPEQGESIDHAIDRWTREAQRVYPEWTRQTVGVLYRHWVSDLERTYTEAYGKSSYFDLTRAQQEHVHREAEQRAREKVEERISLMVKTPNPNAPIDHPDDGLRADIFEAAELFHAPRPPMIPR